MFGWSLSGRSNPRRSRPARHPIRYARPCLEVLEARNVMSIMYPGLMSYAPVPGPTIEAYSPLDNVLRTYGDGFQTITGAYGPQSFATNNTGLFAIDNGGTAVTVSSSNTAAAFELGSGVTSTNTQLPAGASSIALLTTSSFGNNGGTLLEVPSGENAAFAQFGGASNASSSLVTPFTPFVSLAGLPMESADGLIALSRQYAPAPFAPGLSTDPTQGQMGRVTPGFQGSINVLQMPIRATSGLLGGAGAAEDSGGVHMLEPVTPQEQKELELELLNHMRLISWDDSPSPETAQQAENAVAQAAEPLDPLLLPPLLAELSFKDPLLQIA